MATMLKHGRGMTVITLSRAHRGPGGSRPPKSQETGALERDLGKMHALGEAILGYSYGSFVK